MSDLMLYLLHNRLDSITGYEALMFESKILNMPHFFMKISAYINWASAPSPLDIS